jgi:hypothetical protein
MTIHSPPKRVRISRPRNRLTDLVDMPGGLLRDRAIAEATRRVETQRGPANKALDDFVGSLEAIVAPGTFSGSSAELAAIRRVAGQLISLATIYGKSALAEAGERLCDVMAAIKTIDPTGAEALAVHVRALRLLSSSPSPEVVGVVLKQLDKVASHYGVERPKTMPSGDNA